MKKLIVLAIAVLALGVWGVEGKVRLPGLVGDGMVLQRDTPLGIWGWASAGERVEVAFAGKTYKTRADRAGNWSVELPAHPAGGPYTIRVNDVEIHDVLVGDVWLCSGQSNMELPVRRTLDLYADEVRDARNPMIRYFRVPMKYSFGTEEADTSGGEWKAVTPENVLDFSAVAFFFAEDMYALHGVPVGIINTAIGGSPIEAWISPGSLKGYPHYLARAQEISAPGYVDSVKVSDARHDTAWREALVGGDEGLAEGWSAEGFDDGDWKPISLPGYWADKGVDLKAGTMWFRREVDLPAHLAGREAVLRMGVVVDADVTFVNGKEVGSVSYRYPPRIYKIPAGVLKEGRNVIAVRVTSNGGRGGFVEEKPYVLIVGDQAIDLTGDWKCRVGVATPSAPPQTTFQYQPTGLYNGMIAPLTNYALKGFLWYQGESNTGRAAEYKELMVEMINSWRSVWDAPRMPFIFAQLPAMNPSTLLPVESDWAELREAQRHTLKVPHTGMAVTIDLGEWNDIHPLDKKRVAHRLALEARRVAYGETDLVSTGPICESVAREGGSLLLDFSSTGSGIYTNLDLAGFQIAGIDKKYVWARAVVVSGNKIRVWSESVPNPVSVRYAWADNPVGANLRNKEGLPASPFRADIVITENEIGTRNGYDWELWHDRGDVSMVLGRGGEFECKWDSINNVLFRAGRKFDATKTYEQLGDIRVSYGCDYNPVGNSYFCIYGWALDPLVEFYVVEAWGDWRPPGAEPLGQVEIDGGTYDIYETTRTNQPSIQGVRTFKQFWSVRTEKKTEGEITLGRHVEAWEKMGMKLGKIYEIALCVEGFRSSGEANIYRNVMEIKTDSK